MYAVLFLAVAYARNGEQRCETAWKQAQTASSASPYLNLRLRQLNFRASAAAGQRMQQINDLSTCPLAVNSTQTTMQLHFDCLLLEWTSPKPQSRLTGSR